LAAGLGWSVVESLAAHRDSISGVAILTTYIYIYIYIYIYAKSGPGISVGIATDYWLDGPGSNPGGDETFRPSRSVLGPTQPHVKWVPDLSWG